MLFHVFSLIHDATDSGKNSRNVPGREVAGSSTSYGKDGWYKNLNQCTCACADLKACSTASHNFQTLMTVLKI